MKKILLLLMAFGPLLGIAQTTDLTGISDNPPGAYATVTPLSMTLTTNVAGSRGTATPGTFNWFQFTNTVDTAIASTGFLISIDNVTFVSSLIFNTSAANGNQTFYSALSGSNTPGPQSGTVVFKSGPVVVTLPVSGTTNGVPVLSASPLTLTLTDTVGTSGSPQTTTVTFAYLSGSVNVTQPTAPVPIEFSLDKITWSSSLSFNSGSPVPVYARITSSASTGSGIDTIAISASGVTTVKVVANCTVSNPSSVHYRPITIPTTSVTANLTGYTMGINETQTYLKSVGNGGEVQSTNGYDITFSTDAAGTSLLNWEIETYNPVTGQLVAWISIPTLSTSASTTIYMRYNQPSITTFQGGAKGSAWDANHILVAHMNQVLTGAGQTITDYTSNGNNYTSFGTWTSAQTVAGPVGNALQSLFSNNDYLQWTTSGLGGLVGDFTAEAWLNITVQDRTSFSFGATAYGNSTNFYGGFYRLYNGSDAIVDNTITPLNTWVHLVITRSGNNLAIYHNGVATTATQSSGFTYNFQNLFVNQTGVYSQNIMADEVRLSNIGRSAAWVQAEYLNMSAPDTFYSIGIEH